MNTKYKKVLVNNEFLEIYDWMDEKAEIQIKGFEINCQNQKLKEKLEKDLELFKDL